MGALLRFFIGRHLLVNVCAGALLVLGYFSATNLPREFIPNVEAPIFFLTAMLPGASAQDVETKLTIPIEEALEEVEGIDEYTTIVSDNSSFTTIELYDDYDAAQVEATEIDLRAAIDAITDFPDDMEDEPVLRQLNPARYTVLEIALSGPQDAVNETAEALEERLERLETVGSVRPVGLPDPEVRVLVDPVRAREHGITLLDVIDAVRSRNVSSTGGMLESPVERRQVVMWSRFHKPQEVGEAILRFDPEGGALRIRDIARIETGREDTGLIAHANGRRGVVLMVQKRETADIIDTVTDSKRAIADTAAPEGVEVRPFNDESVIVSNRLRLMATNGLIGAVLVTAVLFLFVRPKPALWILVGIPIVFTGALIFVAPFDMTLNLMSLTGFIIVLGMVVDDAVVVAERIVLKRAAGLAPAQAALAGAREMLPAVTAAALTTMLAFAPLLFLGGLPGKIVWQIPAVVVLVLLLSLIESFLVLPAHMSTIRSSANLAPRRFIRALESRYRRALAWVLAHRGLTVGIALAAFAVVMGFIRPLVPFVLFPQDDADRLLIKITAPIGTALERTEAVTADIERQLLNIAAADIEAVTARIGHKNGEGLDKTFGDADNEAVIVVQFKRFDRSRTNAEWMERIPKALHVGEDLEIVYQSEYFGPPTDQPVTIHVLSNDDTARRGVAFEIQSYLNNTPGVVEVDVDEQPGTPQLDLNLNHEKLARLGLDAQTVGTTLAAAFYGIEASEHRDLDDTTELRVQFDPAARLNLDALLETPVRTPSGALARLRDVVEPIETPSPTRIYHRDGFRSATIRASFSQSSGLTALAFGNRLETELFPRFKDIPGLYLFNGGEAEETQKTTGGVALAGALAVIGIGLVIWLMLGSFLEALFVMLVIPFAVAGVFLVFFLHDKPMSLFAMMGAVGLAGVVVNASIVMVDAIHRRRREKAAASREELNGQIIDAVAERLRPIMVTTLTTLGGVMPTAYGFGGYDPIVSIISLGLGWGLAISTLTTLFLVPALYSLAGDLRGALQALGRRARNEPHPRAGAPSATQA